MELELLIIVASNPSRTPNFEKKNQTIKRNDSPGGFGPEPILSSFLSWNCHHSGG